MSSVKYPIREYMERVAAQGRKPRRRRFAQRFVREPYRFCPDCRLYKFGVVMVSEDRLVRLCNECGYERIEYLPPVAKKVIYLDQNAISEMMKAINPATKAHAEGRVEPVWLDLFRKLTRLVQLQLLACPASEYHTRESRFSHGLQPYLKRMYEHLAADTDFESSFEIERHQLLQLLDAWLDGEPDRSFAIDRGHVIRGNLTAWTDAIRVEVNISFPPELIEEERRQRDTTHTQIVSDVFTAWQQEGHRDFWDWFNEEADAYGLMVIRSYGEYLAIGASNRNDPRLPEMSLSWQARTMETVAARISERGTPDGEVGMKALEFLQSEHLRTVPFNRIRALLDAAMARKAAGGKRRPPTPGWVTDVEAISHVLPYCNAIFIDNEMRGLAAENPVTGELNTYGTRIFSKKTMKEFIQYLDQIEQDAPPEHLALVKQVYGDRIGEPFETMYEP